MMDEHLRDNVERLLKGKAEAPSAEFETRVDSLLRSPAPLERKKAIIPVAAVTAAVVAIGLIIWIAVQENHSKDGALAPDGSRVNGTVPIKSESPATQDSEAPWRTDAMGTREMAQREGKPCVVLLGIDGGVHLVENVEACLLPSKEIRAVCGKVPFAAIRGDDAADKTLRDTFELRSFNPWLAVYDAKGELLGARFAQPDPSTPYDAARYPTVLSGMIEAILARPTSVQELERQWKTGALSEVLIETLLERLTEMCAYKRLLEVSRSILDNKNLSVRLRDLGRINSYVGDVCGMGTAFQRDHRTIAHIGERILLEMKDPVLMEKQAEFIWAWGYQQEFDFPAKVKASVKLMEQELSGRTDAEDSKNALKIFSNYCQKQATVKEEELKKLPAGWDHPKAFERLWLCAALGMAAETVEYLSKKSIPRSPYDGWLREAREKLERESRK